MDIRRNNNAFPAFYELIFQYGKLSNNNKINNNNLYIKNDEESKS